MDSNEVMEEGFLRALKDFANSDPLKLVGAFEELSRQGYVT